MSWFEGKKTVVPIDFSDDSEYAVDVALKIAFHPDSVYLVHVAPELSVAGPGVVWDTMDRHTRQQRMEKAFHERFTDTKFHGVNFAAVFGDPGHQIAEYAEEIDAGLIVMPSHGRTGLKRLLIGSVAERVVRLAHCPVLVLRR